jgi:hypothetical protein
MNAANEYTKRGGLSFEGVTRADDRGDRATEETGADRPAAARHLERHEYGKAAALKEEIDGPLPRGRVVRLRPE